MYYSQNPFICKDISLCTLSSKVEFLGIQADFNQVTTTELTAKLNYNRLEAGGLISRLEVGVTLKRYW